MYKHAFVSMASFDGHIERAHSLRSFQNAQVDPRIQAQVANSPAASGLLTGRAELGGNGSSGCLHPLCSELERGHLQFWSLMGIHQNRP